MSETCRGHLWDKIIIELFASSWYIFLTYTKAVYDSKSALGWYSDWVKANKAKHSVLNDGSTVECTESKISSVYPIKVHAEVEVSLRSFRTSALGWAWCLAVLTLGRESLVQNEWRGSWQDSKLVWKPAAVVSYPVRITTTIPQMSFPAVSSVYPKY